MSVCTARWSSTTFCATAVEWDSARPWSRVVDGRLSPASADRRETSILRKKLSHVYNRERESRFIVHVDESVFAVAARMRDDSGQDVQQQHLIQ